MYYTALNSKQPQTCTLFPYTTLFRSLYSGETENGEPRTVYLTEECRLLVTELRKSKQPENFLAACSCEAPSRAGGILPSDTRYAALRSQFPRCKEIGRASCRERVYMSEVACCSERCSTLVT